MSVNIIPCKIFDQPAFVLRTDANDAGLGDHPRDIVEIAAGVKLGSLPHLSWFIIPAL